MQSLESIYQELKTYYESNGNQIDDSRIRQIAWLKRDRMMFEQFNHSNTRPTNASTSGGGSNRTNLLKTPLTTPFTIGTNESFTIEGDLVLNAQLIIEPGGELTVIGNIIENVAIINNGIINLL